MARFPVKSRRGGGRPKVPLEIRRLIRVGAGVSVFVDAIEVRFVPEPCAFEVGRPIGGAVGVRNVVTRSKGPSARRDRNKEDSVHHSIINSRALPDAFKFTSGYHTLF